MAVGDSFTEGRHVRNDETYAAALSRRLGRRVVNLGRWGRTSPTDHVACLKASRWLDLAPKAVILEINGTDPADEAALARREERRRVDPRPRGRLARWLHPLSTRSMTAWLLWRRLLVDPAYERRGGRGGGGGARGEGERRMLAAIRELAALGRARGFRVVLLEHDLPLDLPAPRGVAVVEATLGAELKIPGDGHWNAGGHAEVARRLAPIVGSAAHERPKN